MYISCRNLMIILVGTYLLNIPFKLHAQENSFNEVFENIVTLEDYKLADKKLTVLLKSESLTPLQHSLVLQAVAKNSSSQGNIQLALEQAKTSLIFAQKNNLKKIEAEANKLVGAFSYYKGDHNAAIDAYEKSLQYYKDFSLSIKAANLYNNIALAYAGLGEFNQALDNYEMANKIYQEFGSDVDKIDIRLNIAGLYIQLSRFNTAIETLLDVIEKYEALNINAQNGIALAKSHLASAYSQSGNLELAELYTFESMDYFLHTNETYYVANLLCNLSLLNLRRHDFTKAIEYAEKGKEFSKKHSRQSTYTTCTLNLSLGLYANGDHTKAGILLKEARELAKKYGYKETLNYIRAFSGLFLASNGNPSLAFKENLKYIQKQDERLSSSLNEQLTNFESKLLKQKIDALETQKFLQNKREQDKILITILVISFIFILSFFIYRYVRVQQVKKTLLKMVQLRTNELETANEKLTELSLIDGLTTVHNRRSFDLDLFSQWENVEKSKSCLLLLADIDYFKKYNDNYGHVAGDEALKKVALTMAAHVRKDDKVYRYGGEEFAIIFANHDLPSAKATFDRIHEEIKKLQIEHKGSEYGIISLSAGMCQSSENIDSVQQLIELADMRLYKAKSNGRNILVSNQLEEVRF